LRQIDLDRRAHAELAVDPDVPAALLDDAEDRGTVAGASHWAAPACSRQLRL
jgi:hypothetical protein